MSRGFIRDLWRLTRPFWFSEERWAARGLLAVIIGMSVGVVFLNVQFNLWFGRFYNALQQYDRSAFWWELLVFTGLAAVYILVAVYQVYLRQMLRIRWRTWLTKQFTSEWLRDKAYYAIQTRGGNTDNPDQRIAEDVDQYIATTVNLFLGLLESVMTLVSFAAILWGLSEDTALPWFNDETITIPGFLVWLALVYAVIGTWFTHRVGRPLIRLNFDQQRYEADFRYSMVRFRENVEGVALYGGEADEKVVFTDRFTNVVNNWWAIMRRQKRLTWLTASYGQAAVIFPYLALGSSYFAKTIDLGGLQQTAQAFGQVQSALSFFVDAYTTLAGWRATVDRLTKFTAALDVAHAGVHEHGDIATTTEAEVLRTEGLELAVPEGMKLTRGIDLAVRPGESVLVRGPSGVGKTTLFRVLAQLWPFGRGRVELPRGTKLFLPQKPYLPIGSLRMVTTYPLAPELFTDAEVIEALTACGLSHLVNQLDDQRLWAQILSGGEQQRVAFARALLVKPNWLFMDEATSQLDEASEAKLYRLIRQRLPKTAIVSIGHRATLVEFHERQLDIVAAERMAPAAG